MGGINMADTLTKTVSRKVNGVYEQVKVPLTEAEIAEFNARQSKPKPPRRVGTFTEFMGLFSDEIQAAIDIAATPGTPLSLLMKRGIASNEIDLDSDGVSTALALMLDGGLITEDERDGVLATDFNAV